MLVILVCQEGLEQRDAQVEEEQATPPECLEECDLLQHHLDVVRRAEDHHAEEGVEDAVELSAAVSGEHRLSIRQRRAAREMARERAHDVERVERDASAEAAEDEQHAAGDGQPVQTRLHDLVSANEGCRQ